MRGVPFRARISARSHWEVSKIMRGTRIIFLLCICSYLTVSTSLTSGAEKRDAVLVKILNDWKARQKIADTMLYEVRGHVFVPRDSYPRLKESQGVTPIDHSEYDESIELLLDFRNNRARRIYEGEGLFGTTRSYFPLYEVNLFDGKQYFNYRPHDKNTSDRWTPVKYQPELNLNGPRQVGAFIESPDFLILFGHGSIHSHHSPVTPQKILWPPVASLFSKQERVEYNGRECVLLQTEPFIFKGKYYYELIVDPARGGAVLKWSYYWRGQLYSDVKIEHELTEHGWLPARWTSISYNKPKPPITKTMYVKRRIFNPKIKDSDFKIETTPGMVVYDHKTNSIFIATGPGKPMIPLKEWKLKHPDN